MKQLILMFYLFTSLTTVQCRYRKSQSKADILQLKHEAIFKMVRFKKLRKAIPILKEKHYFNDVLVDTVRNLTVNNHCDILIYYDKSAVLPKHMKYFTASLDVPTTLVDIDEMNFSLITALRSKRKSLLVTILEKRNNPPNCRIFLLWASLRNQKGFMIMATQETGLIRPNDAVVIPTEGNRMDRFMPAIRNRVIVRRVPANKRVGRGRRALSSLRFIVEETCRWCKLLTLLPVGEFRQPGGWRAMTTPRSTALSGAQLAVTYTNSVPNVYPHIVDNVRRLGGLEMKMLQYAAEALNFTFRLYRPTDGEWGRRRRGVWSGKVGEVAHGRADLGIGGIIYTPERAAAVRYTTLFHHELWGIVCPPPSKLPIWPYIMIPFRSDNAVTLFSFIVFLHVIAYLFVVIVDVREYSGYSFDATPLLDSMSNAIKTGLFLYLKFLSYIYFWNIFFCILNPIYENPINNAEDLFTSKNSWGIVNGTTVSRILESSHTESHKAMAVSAQYLTNIGQGWNKIETRPFCLVGMPKRYTQAAIKIKYTTTCGEPVLQVSDENLHTVLGGWIVQPGTPLGGKLSEIIQRLEEFGLMEKWRATLFEELVVKSEKYPCFKKPISALSLSDMRLAFYIPFIGWLMGLAVFGGELFFGMATYLTRVRNHKGYQHRQEKVASLFTLFNKLFTDKDNNSSKLKCELGTNVNNWASKIYQFDSS